MEGLADAKAWTCFFLLLNETRRPPNGGNGDSSSANANVNVNTVNNNGDNASSEAKMATVKTGDNLALVGAAIAVIAVAAAGVAAFALRRRKMN